MPNLNPKWIHVSFPSSNWKSCRPNNGIASSCFNDTILEVDLLNFINPPVGISNMGSSEFPSGYLYRFPSCYNGVDDWRKIKSDICSCGNKCGFKLANNEKRSSALGHTWRLICNRGVIYREHAPKGTTKLKRKNLTARNFIKRA
jgi:hypothetical protein